MWVVQPKVSEEKSFDQRTHIIFEGIIPGGFSGVYSPYVKGIFPGIVFTVTLIPKGEGKGNFELKNVELHAYNNEGSIISNKGDIQPIFVPRLTGKEVIQSPELTIADSNTLTMMVNKSDLVNDSKPYLYIREEDPARTINYIEIAESSEYSPSHVSSYEWHKATNPYLLIYTSRTKYIHAKVVYTNNTFVYKTLPPVENSQTFLHSSRILLYIIIAIALLYLYGKNFLHFSRKISTKH